jgi:hypothetical protein
MYISCPAPEFIEITFQADTHILVGRWLRPVTDEEALLAFDELLAAAKTHQARYWLLDIRRRARSTPPTMRWLYDSYYPQLVQEVGQRVSLVYFMSPNLRSEFKSDGTGNRPRTLAEHSLRMNQCITETEAIAWLQQEQEQDAMLA